MKLKQLSESFSAEEAVIKPVGQSGRRAAAPPWSNGGAAATRALT